MQSYEMGKKKPNQPTNKQNKTSLPALSCSFRSHLTLVTDPDKCTEARAGRVLVVDTIAVLGPCIF